MPQPATLQDVADRAGVHRSTVSLALHNNPRISKEMRDKVQAIASELGYRSNPLVTALMRSRRSRRNAKHVSLAYVTCYPTRYGWRPPHSARPDYFPGAAARALELGYKLEHFWLTEPGMTPARFAQILISRSINGIVIGRLPLGMSEIDLPWEHFSAVAVGQTLIKPDLHRVAEDAFASVSEVMDRMLARGHRRIGYVVSEADDSPMAERWIGGYFYYQMRLGPKDRTFIPVCEYAGHAGFAAHFIEWFERYEPEVILTTYAQPIIDALASIKRRAASKVEIILLVNDKPAKGVVGMHLDPGLIGSLAVEMVVGMMHRGESGLPANPHHVLVPGRWVEGELPPKAGIRPRVPGA